VAVTAGLVANAGLTGITSAVTATAAVVFTSQVKLSSDNSFNLRAGSTGSANLAKLGFTQGTFGGTDNGLKVNQLDVSTISGATQAITAIDAAINSVSAAQAKSGAINNRLDSIINNLTEGSKNMQASRSRILDTDYATETTNLAKQQIIQQAATAMLAQANQSSQSILSLLK
jgi:flagellin